MEYSNVLPSFVNDKLKETCIKNKNYIWFEVYPDEGSYLLTIMFDDKLNIIQWYFDVSKSTNSKADIPYQNDLYLDLVINPKGESKVLDENELLEDLQRKDISKTDFDYAYKTLDKLKKIYANNFEYLLDLTRHIYMTFEEEIINGKI